MINNINNIIIKQKDYAFKNSFTDFVYKQIDEKNKINIFGDPLEKEGEDYLKKLKVYLGMEKNQYLKEALIKKEKDLIDDEKNSKEGIDNILKKKTVNKNTIVLVSHLLDYIKEKIFNENLIKINEYLEHGNLLTKLLELDNDEEKFNKLGEDLIKDIINKFLSELKIDNKIRTQPKFFWNFKIPGFYYFYYKLS